MKADKSKMFSVPLAKIKAEDGAPFPLFLFLRLNDRFIPVRLPGDPIGLAKYEAFLKAHHAELWVPENFRDALSSYLQFLERTGHPVADAAEAAQALTDSAPAGAEAMPAVPAPPPEPPSEEAKIVNDVLTDEELSSDEKAEILSTVSQDILRALNQITTRGEDARAKGVKTAKEVADEILNVAALESDIYKEILALRASQEDIEHSVIVGTLSAMFGMAVGYTDEMLLADLILAAIFHDVGLVRVKVEVTAKDEVKWTKEERTEYEKHVLASSLILEESGTKLHPRVARMIREHHENYDGSGFPAGLRGSEIDEGSQILHMANLFDRICTGKQTGTGLSPAEAFDYIHTIASDKKAVQELQPELVQRVFQFMLSERGAAAALETDARNRATAAMAQAFGDPNK